MTCSHLLLLGSGLPLGWAVASKWLPPGSQAGFSLPSPPSDTVQGGLEKQSRSEAELSGEAVCLERGTLKVWLYISGYCSWLRRRWEVPSFYPRSASLPFPARSPRLGLAPRQGLARGTRAGCEPGPAPARPAMSPGGRRCSPETRRRRDLGVPARGARGREGEREGGRPVPLTGTGAHGEGS